MTGLKEHAGREGNWLRVNTVEKGLYVSQYSCLPHNTGERKQATCRPTVRLRCVTTTEGWRQGPIKGLEQR